MALQIGIDVGGTFTDLVVYDAIRHNLHFFKVPSTKPADLGVLNGLSQIEERFGLKLQEISRIVHGSTVATNALIEKKWAKTALITTQGFRDVLEIGRQQRDSLYDFNVERAEPIVPRERRFEVSERLSASGDVVASLDLSVLDDLSTKLQDVEALAICFLFSYLNPEHELHVKEKLSQKLSVPIVCSAEVLPEYREFERTSTTVVNAALRPIVGGYIENLSSEISQRGIEGAFQIMQSNGGLVDASIAKDHSESLLFSGPAGGVAAALHFAHHSEFSNLIGFDMGGTSCDVSLIDNGRALQRVDSKLAGYEVRVPMLDIHSVGAGGGSIAWIDSGGALRVGPQSAGSVPGPACYGTGEDPTVTDAQLVLGRFDPALTLGSRTLDTARAERAINEHIAAPLGMSLETAASGILEIADAHMERAIRVISVERGYDPRDYALLAFGGGGPLHGCSVADRLGIKNVVVPATAGVLSALGMLLADVKRNRVQSILKPTAEVSAEQLEAQFGLMNAQLLDESGVEAEGEIELLREIEFRYRGQAYEILVQATPEFDLSDLESTFHKTHHDLFGYALPDRLTEIVSLRLEATLDSDSLELSILQDRGDEELVYNIRGVYLGDSVVDEAKIYNRDLLCAGDMLLGPAVIEGSDSTTLLPSDWSLQVDSVGTLILSKSN